MAITRIALIGDFDSNIVAHRAIDQCFALARESGASSTEPVWIATNGIAPGDPVTFEKFAGIWCVPGSPYRNTAGALWAIQWARIRQVPFLGTCGGVQHAVLEYARNVMGLGEAEHAEENPGTSFPLLQKMECALVEKSQRVLVTENGRFRKIYGADSGLEEFHCSYGLNPQFEHLFKGVELEIMARSEDGEARAVALRGHPFFIGTLFQPERKALRREIHPVVSAFFAACEEKTF